MTRRFPHDSPTLLQANDYQEVDSQRKAHGGVKKLITRLTHPCLLLLTYRYRRNIYHHPVLDRLGAPPIHFLSSISCKIQMAMLSRLTNNPSVPSPKWLDLTGLAF